MNKPKKAPNHAKRNRKAIDALADMLEVDMLKMDGFDSCILGVVYRANQGPIVCYSRPAVINALIHQGMTRQEAEEYHGFNQADAWMGEGTPCFLDPI